MVGELTQPATRAADPLPEARDAPSPRRREGLPLTVATLAAFVPVLVAAVRGAARGWVPTSDNGYTAIRAWDVLSSHPPLVGTAASPSGAVKREIYHPGALNYDLLALPVRLLGRGWGVALGIAVINALAIVGIAWLLRRRLGAPAATVAMAAVALLVWSMGSEILYDPWHTHAPLLPFALFLVAVWAVVAGDAAGLVPMVVAGSYASQFHLSFVIPVAGMVAFAAAVCVVRLWWQRRGSVGVAWPERRARAWRWAGITLVVALVCWTQPIYEQLFGPGEGNFLALARASRVELPNPGLADALRVYGGTVALPPWWLPPSFASPTFDPDGDGRPLGLAILGLLGLVVLLAGLGWRAWRRGRVDLAAGAATSLVALGVGAVTLWRMPVTFGIVTFYVRWMWPLAAVVWVVVVVAGLDELRSRRSWRPSPAALSRVAWSGAALAVVAGLAALPTAGNGTSSPPWSIAAVDAIAPEMIAAVEERGPVVVDVPIDWPSIFLGPPLLGELQEAGIPFVAHDRITLRQTGLHREAEPGEAEVRLTFRGGPPVERPGMRLVAAWSSLTEDERDELDRLGDELADVIAREGVRLEPQAAEAFEALRLDTYQAEVDGAAADPQLILAGPTLWSLVRGMPATYVGHSLVDDSSYPDGLLDRWADLAEQRDMQQIAVYIGPEPPT